LRRSFLLFLHFGPRIFVVWISTANIHRVTSGGVYAGNQRNSLFLLYGTEEDIGVDHDAVEVTVVPWDTLHGTGTGYEGLSRGQAGGGSGHLRTEGWARGLIGWNLLSKVFL